MSSETPRPPTPAVYRTSPLYDVYGQTLHPYINLKSAGITPYLTAFKRAIAPFNPFALQQVPTTDSVGTGYKYGERWWATEPYPSRITVDHHFPAHYDPLKNPRYTPPEGSNVLSFKPGFTFEFFPKHCVRTVETFKTCLIANDDDKKKCEHEGNDILAICPPWALDKMKENNKLRLKLEAAAHIKYKKVLEVPDYNKGRTVADIPQRSWADGERTKLRPNSIWADDRYIDITQKEVDEAKARVNQRNAARGHVADNTLHVHTYDRTYEAPDTKIPLYP